MGKMVTGDFEAHLIFGSFLSVSLHFLVSCHEPNLFHHVFSDVILTLSHIGPGVTEPPNTELLILTAYSPTNDGAPETQTEASEAERKSRFPPFQFFLVDILS